MSLRVKLSLLTNLLTAVVMPLRGDVSTLNSLTHSLGSPMYRIWYNGMLFNIRFYIVLYKFILIYWI